MRNSVRTLVGVAVLMVATSCATDAKAQVAIGFGNGWGFPGFSLSIGAGYPGYYSSYYAGPGLYSSSYYSSFYGTPGLYGAPVVGYAGPVAGYGIGPAWTSYYGGYGYAPYVYRPGLFGWRRHGVRVW